MTNLIFRINNEAIDASYAAQPSYYVTVANDDTLIFSAGKAGLVYDGGPIPDQAALNQAATLLSPTLATIVAHYFLADVTAGILKEIHNAGNADKQYVFCCSFDGPTASEPQLEAWDTADINTYNLLCLGAGVPASSWYKAKCTTVVSPGATWTGTPLAGSGGSNVVLLNAGGGALTVAKDLYFAFHVNIPAAVTTPGAYLPVLLVTYCTN